MLKDFGDYIIYVDESGDHNLTSINKDYPLFALAFVIFEKEYYRTTVIPAFTAFKNKYWGHDQVILHEHEIRKNKNEFSFLRTNKELRENFLNDLTKLIEDLDFKFYCSVIKKDKLLDKYPHPYGPYEIGMLFCMERTLNFLKSKQQENKTHHIVIERRGKKEDKDLELEFRRICDNQSNFGWKSEDFKIMDFELIPTDKKSNSSGLQLADLIARPIALRVLKQTQENKAYKAIASKGEIKRFP